MNIAKNSPHLDRKLFRLMKKGLLIPSDYRLIDDAFCISMKHGGKDEIDFIRDPEISFNPRPARAAIILINDAKETSALSITATILASISPYAQNLNFNNAVLNLVKESSKAASKIKSTSAALITCSLWLDRARHLHQVAEENRNKTWPNFIEMHKQYLKLAEKHSQSLYILLHAWEERFKKQFNI